MRGNYGKLQPAQFNQQSFHRLQVIVSFVLQLSESELFCKSCLQVPITVLWERIEKGNQVNILAIYSIYLTRHI